MFKVKYSDEEYIVYAVNYNEERDNTLFLIYQYDNWNWVSSCLCELIVDKEVE